MPKPKAQLPTSLAGRPFSATEAREAGVSRTILTHSRFLKPFFNVRVPDEILGSTSPEQGFAQILRPGEAFSHTTALRLLGCPIRCDDMIHLTVPKHRRARRAAGVTGHSTRREFEALVLADNLPVIPPALALIQAASMLPLKELIIAIDHLASRKILGIDGSTESICEEVRSLPQQSRMPGSRNLRKALKYARVGSESRMESLLRLLLEAYGYAHCFETQVEIVDDAGWIGRFDFVCERFKLIVEYDGEQHREHRKQYLKDQRRLDRVRAAGYMVIRLQAEDVVGNGRRAAVRRIADALGSSAPISVVVRELV